MRHRICRTIPGVFGENVWVISDVCVFPMDTEHARCLPLQIKQDIYGLKWALKDSCGLLDIFQGLSNYPLLLSSADWCDCGHLHWVKIGIVGLSVLATARHAKPLNLFIC